MSKRGEYRNYCEIFAMYKTQEDVEHETEIDACEADTVSSLVSEIEDEVNDVIDLIKKYELKEALEKLEELSEKLY